jgi:hypothetical protein
MRSTLSHSVNTTTSGADGQPDTAPPFETTSVLGERLSENLRTVWKRDRMDDLTYRFWDAAATVRHWFGFHTMVPTERWDLDAGSIQFVGRTCWKCPFSE